jgi:hypothetical protein
MAKSGFQRSPGGLFGCDKIWNQRAKPNSREFTRTVGEMNLRMSK